MRSKTFCVDAPSSSHFRGGVNVCGIMYLGRNSFFPSRNKKKKVFFPPKKNLYLCTSILPNTMVDVFMVSPPAVLHSLPTCSFAYRADLQQNCVGPTTTYAKLFANDHGYTCPACDDSFGVHTLEYMQTNTHRI